MRGVPNSRRRSSLGAIKPEDFAPSTRVDLHIPLSMNSLGVPLSVPFIIIRGRSAGPTLGLSAAIHGDELNGIRIIHALLDSIDPSRLSGALICCPVANVPSFEAGQRLFPEVRRDLNHVFPGKADGTAAQQYARAFMGAFLPSLTHLIDIHTASEGRTNSFYVRADLHAPSAREMALKLEPELVLHGRSGDGTLRNAARRRGVAAVTMEAGNPDEFQGRMIKLGTKGIRRVMASLGMISSKSKSTPRETPVICGTSRWLRAHAGGLLETRFGLLDQVSKGQVLGAVIDPFGHEQETLIAPTAGVVIGMSRSPLAVPGTRFCHLGIEGEPPPQRARTG